MDRLILQGFSLQSRRGIVLQPRCSQAYKALVTPIAEPPLGSKRDACARLVAKNEFMPFGLTSKERV
jgi:hypothetical protein